MAISKDDISTVLDHMVSIGYPDRDDGGDMDDVADHIRNYVSANIDDLMEAINEPEEDMFDDCELHDTDSLSDIIGGGQG